MKSQLKVVKGSPFSSPEGEAYEAVRAFFDTYDIDSCESELWDLLADSFHEDEHIGRRASGRVFFCRKVLMLLKR